MNIKTLNKKARKMLKQAMRLTAKAANVLDIKKAKGEFAKDVIHAHLEETLARTVSFKRELSTERDARHAEKVEQKALKEKAKAAQQAQKALDKAARKEQKQPFPFPKRTEPWSAEGRTDNLQFPTLTTTPHTGRLTD